MGVLSLFAENRQLASKANNNAVVVAGYRIAEGWIESNAAIAEKLKAVAGKPEDNLHVWCYKAVLAAESVLAFALVFVVGDWWRRQNRRKGNDTNDD